MRTAVAFWHSTLPRRMDVLGCCVMSIHGRGHLVKRKVQKSSFWPPATVLRSFCLSCPVLSWPLFLSLSIYTTVWIYQPVHKIVKTYIYIYTLIFSTQIQTGRQSHTHTHSWLADTRNLLYFLIIDLITTNHNWAVTWSKHWDCQTNYTKNETPQPSPTNFHR